MNNQTQTSDYQNTSAQEIEKFSQHAHEWWDEQGPLKTLHQINPTRMAWIAKHADLANAQTIDIGCGGGILSESLAKAGALVTGLDMASDSIEIARTHAQAAQLNIDYQISTAEAWAQAHPAEYEVVTCMELLEHVPDPASVIHAAAQLLAPGGVVFFSTINRNPKAWALTIGAAEYLLKMPCAFAQIIHTCGLFDRLFLRIFEQLCGQRLRPADGQALFNHGFCRGELHFRVTERQERTRVPSGQCAVLDEF